MTRDEITETLITIVKKEKNVSDDLLRPETALTDLGIDSLDALTILFSIEEEFGIGIPDTRAKSIKTLGDMIDTVQELVPPS